MGERWSWFAENRDKPVGGPEHQAYRDEAWIGGADCACCHYLTMLTRRDYFLLPLTVLWRDIVKYAAAHASPSAIAFGYKSTPEISEFALPFLKQQFQKAFGIEVKLTKEEKGLILLLKHPEWSDEQIRVAVKTTEKQMARWGLYRRARAVQGWYQSAPGE
jgi:hypothetical protein